MPIVSLFFFIIFLLFFVSGFFKNSDPLSPIRIFGLIWSAIFGLAEFKLSYLQFSWSNFDWFVVLLGVIAFLIGCYIVFILNIGHLLLPVSKIRDTIAKTKINEKRLFKIIFLYVVLYIICFVAEWLIEGYIPLFTSNPAKARLNFGVFGLHLIVSSANVILFLVFQYFIFIKANYKKKFYLMIFALLALANYILIVQRYGLFVLIMMVVGLFYYSGRKINPKVLLWFSIILLTIIFGIQSLRESELAKTYILLNSKMKSTSNQELAIPYMYLVMNVENFTKFYPSIDKYSYGFFSLDFLTATTGIKHTIEEYFNLEKFKHYIGGYNTYPFFWPYYLDFGFVGLAFIPLILGFFITNVFYSFKKNPSMNKLVLYSILFSTIVISYSSDPLTRLDMMYNYFVIIAVQNFIK